MLYKSNFETWDLRPHRVEIVGRSATLTGAISACRGDDGRTLTIYDGFGRVAAMVRDGRLLTESEVAR